MNSADKILRIARGGKPITPEMSAADRVMAYAMPEAEPQTQAQIQPPTQPQDNSAWGRFKNFAGSNGGRTLWGGLGTALAVGLTGGNVKDALGYGVIGAGNTVETLNQNKQYQNALQERQLERQRKIDEAAKNRQFLQQQQTRAFGNQQQMANLQYENSLNSMLIGKIVDHGWEADKPARELAAKKRAIQLSDLPDGKKDYLVSKLYGVDDDAYYSHLLMRDPNNPDALDYFNNQNKLQGIIDPIGTWGKYAGVAKDGGMMLDPDALNHGSPVFAAKPIPGAGLAEFFKRNGFAVTPAMAGYEDPDTKTDREVGAYGKKAEIDRDTHAVNAGVDNHFGNQEAWRDAEIEKEQKLLDNELKRGFEVFKTTLPAESIIEANQAAQALQAQGWNITAGDILYNNYKKEMLANRNTAANINKTVADTKKIKAEIPFIGQDKTPAYQPGDIVNGFVMTGNKKYDDAFLGEVGKKAAQSQKSEQDYQAMVPTVVEAMKRGLDAAKDGSGIGPIGGRFAALGLNWNDNAGNNYADIQSANTQMNTILRKKLGATGLTGSELNSAIEAEAYRYQINPTDNESIIQRKLQNFAKDHLGINDFNASSPANDPLGIL